MYTICIHVCRNVFMVLCLYKLRWWCCCWSFRIYWNLKKWEKASTTFITSKYNQTILYLIWMHIWDECEQFRYGLSCPYSSSVNFPNWHKKLKESTHFLNLNETFFSLLLLTPSGTFAYRKRYFLLSFSKNASLYSFTISVYHLPRVVLFMLKKLQAKQLTLEEQDGRLGRFKEKIAWLNSMSIVVYTKISFWAFASHDLYLTWENEKRRAFILVYISTSSTLQLVPGKKNR